MVTLCDRERMSEFERGVRGTGVYVQIMEKRVRENERERDSFHALWY